MTDTYTVLLQPVGVEFEAEDGETILDAAFRQGISLPHGCKEGQCSACKSILLEGDIELKKHSTFALSETERDADHILLCCSLAESDVEIELLNFDEELLSKSIAVKEFAGVIAGIEKLTSDIRQVDIELEGPLKFWAGQYVEITVTTSQGQTITRSFSMANSPLETEKLRFIIKKYPEGKFSNELDDGGIRIGAKVTVKGPYGSCFRREGRQGPMILVGAGSGMSPIWAILNDHLASGEQRDDLFFYGARTRADLFFLDEISILSAAIPILKFIPVLSEASDDAGWTGDTGFVHEVVDDHLKLLDTDGNGDVYACGPPPMVDALMPVLFMHDFDGDRTFVDRFTVAKQADELQQTLEAVSR